MSEIKKQFYETFKIEKKPVYSGSRLYNPFLIGYDYPEITDSILLNLLCIINKYGNIVSSYNIEKLKDEILIKTITLNEDIDIKPQVRALFSNK